MPTILFFICAIITILHGALSIFGDKDQSDINYIVSLLWCIITTLLYKL